MNIKYNYNTTRYLTLASLLIAVAIIGINANPTHAESSSANASVTVANTISLTLTGGDLVINNLTPGNAADSNAITATVTSNSPYGFKLAATTGTSTGTDSLVNTADSNFTFTNLSTNKATLANFSDNTWGYSYSTDGTNWISGDYGQASAGYSGLPLDNDDSGVTSTTLFNSDSYLGSKAVQFKIGAKSAATQAAGTYTNTINFYAITNPEPLPTMQDFAANRTATTCTTMNQGDTILLADERDNTPYTIGKLADDKCWMLDNLAIDLVSEKDSLNENNTNASNTTLGYLKGDTSRDPNTDSGGKYATSSVTNWTTTVTDSASVPLVDVTNRNTIPTDAISITGQYKTGGFYNYCAASAGSYCYGNGYSTGTSSGDATEDICPKGWRMPTGGNSVGELFSLANSYTHNYNSVRVAFRIPLSGYFSDSSVKDNNTVSHIWSTTRQGNSYMYYLYADTSNISPSNNNYRLNGNSVRCILNTN